VVDLPKREGHVKKVNKDEDELLSFTDYANKHDKLLENSQNPFIFQVVTFVFQQVMVTSYE
jgi:hypothetical protein